jgi:hypothetical protein
MCDNMHKSKLIKKIKQPKAKNGKNNLDNAINLLNSDPNENNWKAFSNVRKKNDVKYYKIVYSGKLHGISGLKTSYAELYNSRYKLIGKVPIMIKNGKEISGATIYLKGLSILNKVD